MTSTPLSTQHITFIGGGNMARSLIAGLRARGVSAEQIHVGDPNAQTRHALVEETGISGYASGSDAAAESQIWILAVKPQVMREVCTDLAAQTSSNQPLVISIAAGISSEQLATWLTPSGTSSTQARIIRCMPNTPALLGEGMTALYATDAVTADDRTMAEAILSTAGKTVWIEDESLMDAVTAVSGSGPAYIFLLAESMQKAAIAQGLSADVASELVLQTILGAARMLSESNESASTLRQRVTSPGGTTAAAIASLEAGGFEALVEQAIDAATQRGRELASGQS